MNTHEEALRLLDWPNRSHAMNKKLDFMRKNQVWTIFESIQRTSEHTFIEKDTQNSAMLFRARLFAKGFVQIYDRYNAEIYSSGSTLHFARTVIAKDATSNQPMHQVM